MIQPSAGQDADSHLTLRCAVKRIATTNPLLDDAGSQRVLRLIYDSATKYHPETGAMLPYIAVGSATGSLDPMEISWENCIIGEFDYTPSDTWAEASKPELIIFYDFEDVYWHDNVQMGIRDMLFTFHAWATHQYSWAGHPLKDMAGGPGSNYSETQWLSLEVAWASADGLRAAIRFTLQEPRFSVFEYYLSAPLLPYHIWGGKSSGQLVDGTKIWCDQGYDIENETYWQPSMARGWTNPKPVGSGPFAWADSDMGGITLKSWDRHFYGPGYKYESKASPAVRPNIDRLSLKFYTYEENALLDLEAGAIDLVAWELPLSAISRFAGNPNIDIQFLAGARPVNLVFNMDRKSFGYSSGQGSSISGSGDTGKPLRLAIAHCVNSNEIGSLARMSLSVKLNGLFSQWQNTSAPEYAYDTGETVNILRKAGYGLKNPSAPPGPDNVWLNPDGSNIGSSTEGQIDMLVPDYEQDSLTYQVGTMLSNQMLQSGIDVRIVSMKSESLWEKVFEGDFDICLVQQGYRTRTLATAPAPIGGGETGTNAPPNPPNAPTPFDGETDVSMWGPALSVRVFDPDGDSMNVKFYWAETDILIGSNHEVRSGETVSVEAPILEPLTTYSWYVTAEDHQYAAVSPIWKFTTERGLSRSGNGTVCARACDNNTWEATLSSQGTRSKAESFSVGIHLPRIYSRRPENYYFSNFHSGNIETGLNYCGYRNASYDRLIEAAMFPVGLESEKSIVRDAMASIGYDVPMLELYHPRIIEAFRSDRFTGFLDDGSGSLLNLDSVSRLRVQNKERLVARFIYMPMTVTTNATFPIRIRITDAQSQPMAGVFVALEHSSGTLSALLGQTDYRGQFSVNFTAPPVSPGMESGLPVMISLVSATLDGYRDAGAKHALFMVYPESANPLSVTASPVLDVVRSGGFTNLDILVTDERNLPVADASVMLEMGGALMKPDMKVGLTAPDGRIRFTLTAPDNSGAGECTVNITASKVAHVSGGAQVSIMVVPPREVAAPEQTGDTVWAYAGVPAAILLACAAYLWRRKR